jgi:hypothetical protein
MMAGQGTHMIEAVGQGLDLIARIDCDPVIEITAADAYGSCRQNTDWHHHVPR